MMMNVLTKFLLLMLVYPSLTFITCVAIGVAAGNPLLGLRMGIMLVGLSLLGLVPVLGPLLYLDSLLVLDLLQMPWLIPAMFGLMAAISFTVITTRMIIDMLRKAREHD